MKMAKWILPLLLLVGCGDGYIDNNHGYGYHYDEADIETGLRVRYSGAINELSLADIATIYKDVSSCAGMTGAGPLVVFTTDPLYFNSARVGGLYFYSGTVVVDVVSSESEYVTTVRLRHELLHHLLDMNGEPRADNAAHMSQLFFRCHLPTHNNQ